MNWVLVTERKLAAGMLAAVRALGDPVTAVVVGPRELADAVAALDADEVRWVEPVNDVPVEAFAQGLAEAAGEVAPRVLVSSSEPPARALLGAVAARLGAAVIPGLLAVSSEGDELVVRRSAIGGEVVETLATSQPVAGIFGGEDVAGSVGGPSTPRSARGGASSGNGEGSGSGGGAGTGTGEGSGAGGAGSEGELGSAVERAEIEPLDLAPADMRVLGTQAAAAPTGLTDAARVVGFGRGVRAKDDVALIERLAATLGAEIGCTMPVADDLRWLDKARYIGRSGQHIAPRLYLAVGIGGAPQHMEGVREANVVAAVNNDPDARVFRAADYGIVGDLYEVVPALIDALQNEGEEA